MLLTAAIILVTCGIAHSFLGEKYILSRLFRRDNVPHIFGSDEFTKGTLRFCWHITSIAWFGFAALLINSQGIDIFSLNVIGTVFLLSSLFSMYFTKAKHLSWLALLMVSILSFLARSSSI